MNAYLLEPNQVRKLITESAQTEALVTLSWRNKSHWRVGKAKLSAAQPANGRFGVRSPITSEEGIIALLPPGLNLGVSLRSGHKKFVFASTVIETDSNNMHLAWPDHVQQKQRRCNQRVEWHGEQPLEIRFWAGGLERTPTDIEGRGKCWTATLVDISAGGMRIRWDADQPFPMEVGSLAGCEFAPESNRSALRFDCLCRHTEPLTDGYVAAGMQFIGLECSVEGRAKLRHLARVVSRLQREHIHRKATDLSYRLRHL
jgi:c-di-GMP-binding flagellar brake protein YcgR